MIEIIHLKIGTNIASGKMNKTIYVAGKVYDLATMSSQEIQDDVQSRLDNHLGKDHVIFRISVCENEVIINFWRSCSISSCM